MKGLHTRVFMLRSLDLLILCARILSLDYMTLSGGSCRSVKLSQNPGRYVKLSGSNVRTVCEDGG